MGNPELSVVIPAYDERARIAHTVREATAYLERHHASFELVVVDDGSGDDSAETAARECRRHHSCRLVRLPKHRGKGAAVRRGVLESSGERVLFMDADMSTPMAELSKLWARLDAGADVAMGSRRLRGSDVQDAQPRVRRALGLGFNLLVRRLGLSQHRDTQCGFKLFTADAARRLFSRSTLDGYVFDVELLMNAAQLGLRVAEVPVVWHHTPHSRLRLLHDTPGILLELSRLTLNRWRHGPP